MATPANKTHQALLTVLAHQTNTIMAEQLRLNSKATIPSAEYLAIDLKTKLEHLKDIHQIINQFNLSDRDLVNLWKTIIQMELIVQSINLVLNYAALRTPLSPEQMNKVVIPQSAINELRQYCPPAFTDPHLTILIDQSHLPPLAKAYLNLAHGYYDEAAVLVQETVANWVYEGFIKTVDGTAKYGYMSDQLTVYPDHSFGSLLTYFKNPPFLETHDLLNNLFPLYHSNNKLKDEVRAKIILNLILNFGLTNQEVKAACRTGFERYSLLRYRSLPGLLEVTSRQKLINGFTPLDSQDILKVASYRLDETFQRYQSATSKAEHLSILIQVCQESNLTQGSRLLLIDSLWQTIKTKNEACSHLTPTIITLSDRVAYAEALLNGKVLKNNIERIIKVMLAEKSYLSQLEDLARKHKLYYLIPQIKRTIKQQAKERATKKRQAEEQEAAQAKQERQEWLQNLTEAVKTLEKEPGAGNFLLEKYLDKPD